MPKAIPVLNFEVWIQRNRDEEAEMVACFDDEHSVRMQKTHPEYEKIPALQLKRMLAEMACARQASMEAREETGKGLFQVRASTNGTVLFERKIRWV